MADAIEEPLRLLFVDPDEDYRRFVARVIRSLPAGEGWDSWFVARAEEAKGWLASMQINAVIASERQDDDNVANVLRAANENAGNPARILVAQNLQRALQRVRNAPDQVDLVWDKSWDARHVAREFSSLLNGIRHSSTPGA